MISVVIPTLNEAGRLARLLYDLRRGGAPAAIVFGWLKNHALFHLGVPPGRSARI